MSLLEKIQNEAQKFSAFPVTNVEELEKFRLHYLSTRGLLRQFFDTFRALSGDEKKSIGKPLNQLKQQIEQHYADAQKRIRMGAASPLSSKGEKDFSLPAEPINIGARHPISLVRSEILSIFERIHFNVSEGPEIEDEWYNFTALNMPESHPARDMQDTFYIKGHADHVLRTHTSNTQIREMKKGVLPIRVVCPGKVFRNETISARAHCFFHQIEGLYVDKKCSFADLKQTLTFFTREFFGAQCKTRLRPSYFPFTEPSAEMDIQCLLCAGAGCSLCKHTGWLEILGCGMVHPKVLENCGINPDEARGFAFGMGIERIAMLRYQIKDIRMFSDNDVRVLGQFSML